MSDVKRVIGEIHRAILAYYTHDVGRDLCVRRGADALAALLSGLADRGLLDAAELGAMRDEINDLPRTDPEFRDGMLDVVERHCPDWRVALAG